MKWTCIVICIAHAVPAMAAGQDAAAPRSLGVYGGADVSGAEPADYRLGVRYSTPLAGGVEIYPALDLIIDGRRDNWQGVLALRVHPLENVRFLSAWYFGGGAVLRSSGARKALLTGLDIPLQRVLAFGELRFHGPVERGDGQLELLFGLGVGIR